MKETGINNEMNGVAIVGMAGRFPGAKNVDEFWVNLLDGRESISSFTDDELSQMVHATEKNRDGYIRARGVLENAENFDAQFFKIPPREAEVMDPQQRIFLEVAWEAMEHSGNVPEKYTGTIGVFAGSGENTYMINHVLPNKQIAGMLGNHQKSLLNAPDYIALRASYKMGLSGPSVSLYTGCSTSLVAVCHGVDSLLSYQCDMILAGGSFVWCPQNQGYLYHPDGILSADGHCRPFDEKACGTVFSNGAGAVVMKRLEDAISDNDQIYAVIRGVALNNDGADKVSFTAPSVKGQAAVIAMAQAMAGVTPQDITYIETHGTGTPIGDPIEIAALKKVFDSVDLTSDYRCAIGSVKSNIGHLDAAAGVAGLIKTVLVLHHKKMPPTLHFTNPNAALELESSCFFVNNRLVEWEKRERPYFAGVSSFGVGGTNAHVVLEEAPPGKVSRPADDWELLTVSAKSEEALKKSAENLVGFLEKNENICLADVAYTLCKGRSDFRHRQFAVCKRRQSGLAQLEEQNRSKYVRKNDGASGKELVFMFPGQGVQHVNMGLELYKSEKKLRELVDGAADYLVKDMGCDIRDILYPKSSEDNQKNSLLNETCYTQPILFAVEYAMAEMWIEWGIKPHALVGHSIGEYVAACLAGVFSFEDALALLVKRGQLIYRQPKGKMLAVFLEEEKIAPYLDGQLSLAAVNNPGICVVSGPSEDIEELYEKLFKRNIRSKKLNVSHAFHSGMMNPMLDEYYEAVSSCQLSEPRIPFISNVSGNWIKKEEAKDPGYWTRHVRSTVRFSDGLATLMEKDDSVFLEVGPGVSLNIIAKHHPMLKEGHSILSSAPHPMKKDSERYQILETMGFLWLSGFKPNWKKYFDEKDPGKVPLPTYPFEYQRYWLPEYGTDNADGVQAAKVKESASQDIENIQAEREKKKELKIIKRTPVEIEEQLNTIWRNILGVKSIDPDDNFFELGGSSLLAVTMSVMIEEQFCKKMPVSALYEAPTLKKLARYVASGNHEGQWRSLVAIRERGGSPPLFLVHGAGGNVLIYRQLAECLGENQPVYGLQSKGMSGEAEFHTCVEDMATHYADEILTIQPDGPFYLGGYCMGGCVAFEMARKLSAMGKEVGNVFLMESYNYSKMKRQKKSDKIRYYCEKIDFHWRNFMLLDADDKLKFLKEKASVARARKEVWAGLLITKLGKSMSFKNRNSENYYRLWENNDAAADNYVPRPYNGPVTHFMPMKEYQHHLEEDMMWDKLTTCGLKKVVIPAYPAGMLINPFVKSLSEEIMACIEKNQ